MSIKTISLARRIGAFTAAALLGIPGFAAAGPGHGFGGAHFGGFGGAHMAAPHFAAAPRFDAPHISGQVAGGTHLAVASGWGGHASGWSAHGNWTGQPHWAPGRAGYGPHWVPGRSWYGPRWGYHPYWHGGWWHGYYWPPAYYGWAFPWFLPVLPVGCVTFWWSGIPYYYVDSVYYVWDSDANGYVVTNPPPVDDSAASTDSGMAAYDGSTSAQASAPASAPDDVYMYPKKGQSAEQQSTDRYECHKWAQDQTGFDPTQPNGGSASASAQDYRRAMIACLDARGYSAQ